MVKDTTPEEAGLVACEVCLKEIPESVAVSQEGDDYTQHFCGLACYEKWKQRQSGEGSEGGDEG